MKKIILISICYVLVANCSLAQKTIQFPSLDSIQIGADIYMNYDHDAPLVILFHQATFSRGEYLEIAPELNKLGFNCMAVDLRSGNAVNGIENITFRNAKKAKMPYRFIDCYQDIRASVAYAKSHFARNRYEGSDQYWEEVQLFLSNFN